MDDAVDKCVELLVLCQALKSERDGVDRPAPGVPDKSKTLDQFAVDINRSISLCLMLKRLLPMQEALTKIGMDLEKEGKVALLAGEDYADAALAWMAENKG